MDYQDLTRHEVEYERHKDVLERVLVVPNPSPAPLPQKSGSPTKALGFAGGYLLPRQLPENDAPVIQSIVKGLDG